MAGEQIMELPTGGKRAGFVFFIFGFVSFALHCFAITKPVCPGQYAGTIRVACVGDSITYGAGIENRQENSYPARLQAADQ